jgi:hypothetical protein
MAREELDFDHRDMTKAEGDVDKNLAVRFYKMPMKNEAESDKAGRPIFEDVDMSSSALCALETKSGSAILGGIIRTAMNASWWALHWLSGPP